MRYLIVCMRCDVQEVAADHHTLLVEIAIRHL